MVDKNSLIDAQLRFYKMAALMLLAGDAIGEIAEQWEGGETDGLRFDPEGLDGSPHEIRPGAH